MVENMDAGCSCGKEGDCNCNEANGLDVDELVSTMLAERFFKINIPPTPENVILAYKTLGHTTKRVSKLHRGLTLAKKKLARRETQLRCLVISTEGKTIDEVKDETGIDITGLRGGNEKTRAAAMEALTEKDRALVDVLAYKIELAKEDLDDARIDVDMIRQLIKLRTSEAYEE